MKIKSKLEVNKKEFLSLNNNDFLEMLFNTINFSININDTKQLKKLPPIYKILLWWHIDKIIIENGFKFLYLSKNRIIVPCVITGMQKINNKSMVDILKKADKIYKKNRTVFYLILNSEFTGLSFDKLHNTYDKCLEMWESLYDKYLITSDKTRQTLVQYIKFHANSFSFDQE